MNGTLLALKLKSMDQQLLNLMFYASASKVQLTSWNIRNHLPCYTNNSQVTFLDNTKALATYSVQARRKQILFGQAILNSHYSIYVYRKCSLSMQIWTAFHVGMHKERVVMTNFGHLSCTQYCCKPLGKVYKKCTCTQT